MLTNEKHMQREEKESSLLSLKKRYLNKGNYNRSAVNNTVILSQPDFGSDDTYPFPPVKSA